MRDIGYHHGDLRRVILAAATEAITESGPHGWSLRELARRAGVSHAAPAHHFGDKAGLFTALATEGYALLADALQEAATEPKTKETAKAGFLEAGLAYVAFAVEHPAHFQVMFQPSLYHSGDAELESARTRAGDLLDAGANAVSGAGGSRKRIDTTLAGWSIAHGFASLWLSGALPASAKASAVDAARPVLKRLLEK